MTQTCNQSKIALSSILKKVAKLPANSNVFNAIAYEGIEPNLDIFGLTGKDIDQIKHEDGNDVKILATKDIYKVKQLIAWLKYKNEHFEDIDWIHLMTANWMIS